LLAFGALNSDLTNNHLKPAGDRSKLLRVIKFNGLSVHAAKGADTATRVQGSKTSYLDYFLSMGVEVTGLTVGKAIGTSDHRMISCSARGVIPVRRRNQKYYSKTRAQWLLKQLTHINDPEKLLRLPSENFFEEISCRLRTHSIVYESKPKSFFKVIQVVEDELKGRFPNWNRIRNEMSSCERLEFHALVDKANSHKLEGDWKKFHMIIKNILGTRKASASVQEIEDPGEQRQVLHDSIKIQSILLSK